MPSQPVWGVGKMDPRISINFRYMCCDFSVTFWKLKIHFYNKVSNPKISVKLKKTLDSY